MPKMFCCELQAEVFALVRHIRNLSAAAMYLSEPQVAHILENVASLIHTAIIEPNVEAHKEVTSGLL